MSRPLVTAVIALGTISVVAGFLTFVEGTGRWKAVAFIVFVLSVIGLAAALVLAYFRMVLTA